MSVYIILRSECAEVGKTIITIFLLAILATSIGNPHCQLVRPSLLYTAKTCKV